MVLIELPGDVTTLNSMCHSSQDAGAVLFVDCSLYTNEDVWPSVSNSESLGSIQNILSIMSKFYIKYSVNFRWAAIKTDIGAECDIDDPSSNSSLICWFPPRSVFNVGSLVFPLGQLVLAIHRLSKLVRVSLSSSYYRYVKDVTQRWRGERKGGEKVSGTEQIMQPQYLLQRENHTSPFLPIHPEESRGSVNITQALWYLGKKHGFLSFSGYFF